MKASIVKSPVGLFAFNEENKMIDYILFSREIKQAVEILKKLLNGDYVEQLCIMLKNLKKNNYDFFIFEDFRTARSIQEKLGIEYSIENPSQAGETFRAKMNQIVLETKCFEDINELYNYIHEIYMEMTKITIQQAFSRRDLLLSQAILAFDDIDKIINLFCNRLREWYGYYFPELDKFIENNNIYLKTISSHIKRNNYTIENVMAMGVNQDKALQISSLASKSMGTDINKKDLNEIQVFAKEVYN
ncbi:MAG: hypothetical protein JSV20_00340 [Candidatus Bathyarchaeota archaeon]|nr:MAG: hypothetical protein JSV20_00340 [Candidatus Bathyarchaeota archaeon]